MSVLVARTTDALAHLVWGHWRSWFAANADWRVEAPMLEVDAVLFLVRGPAGEVRLRIERNRGPAAGTLQVHPDGTPADPAVYRALADRVLALDRRGLRWERPAAAGRRLELFISSGCNLHCYFCCESTRIREKSWMPWEQIDGYLTRAAAEGVAVIQFMGGEATLHPRFPDALRRARALGMGTFVITNLLRWEDPAFADAVAPVLDEVMVSVHAWGAGAGERVTGRAGWWERFGRAAENARRTLAAPPSGCRVRASTVLSRDNVDDLERIADVVLSFRPTTWVMGAGVPIPEARRDVLDGNLTLSELAQLRPRFEALAARCRAQGCRLVTFCIPHCVLGPALWDDSHDFVVGDQDLSPNADPLAVNFWSQAEYLTAPRAVTLARSRPSACTGCTREAVCGGYFTEYFARVGDAEVRPVSG